MNVLGLDMSTVKTGYSLFIDNKLKDYGVWQIESNEISEWRDRIKYMASQIQTYIQGKDIDVIYVEDVPPIIENTQTVKVLSTLQGMLISLGVIHNIDIHFIPVKTWKTIIGINIVNSKEANAVKKKIQKEYGKLSLNKFKAWLKAIEKRLSVESANHIYNLQLVYKSPSSKFNDDDIADSINIVHSQISKSPYKYNLHTFQEIVDEFYSRLPNSEK